MTAIAERLSGSPHVSAVVEALQGDVDAWIVGGTVRDAYLGRPLTDVDLAVKGDPEQTARTLATAFDGPVFPLSEAFGAWRALHPEGWVCDVSPLQGSTIEDDLQQRDFTVNALAVPLANGEPIDPTGGQKDLEAGTLRVIGPGAYSADPLRPLRLARLAAETGLRPDHDTERLTLEAAHAVPQASGERIFAELRRLVTSTGVLDGLEIADRLGLVAAVLPEVAALHGVEQSHFHHLDVYDHTVEVLRQALWLEDHLGEVFAELEPELRSVLDEQLADELTRLEALRFGALLHDIGKPVTRDVLPNGRVTFIGHDSAGAEMIGELGRRLRMSEKLRSFLAGITRRHLVLGFLVHERPLSRAVVYRYLTTCAPVEIEVTVLTCADRLATRGKNAEAAIAAHLELARELMADALRWRREGAPRAPVRGDELAAELGIQPGPELGELMKRLAEASFTGEAGSRAEAVELARRLRQNHSR